MGRGRFRGEWGLTYTTLLDPAERFLVKPGFKTGNQCVNNGLTGCGERGAQWPSSGRAYSVFSYLNWVNN